MNAEFYQRNRRAVFEKLPEGSVLFLHSGTAPVRSNDQDMAPFSVNRNFYYLTGITEKNVWLMLSKGLSGHREKLFIAPSDEQVVQWDGEMLSAEAAGQQSGLPPADILYNYQMERIVGQTMAREGIGSMYFSFDRVTLAHAPTPSERYAKYLGNHYPGVRIENAAPLMYSLRSIKTREEVEAIRTAADETVNALTFMLKTAKPGEMEYQWAADYHYHVERSGMCRAFSTIAASGKNAVTLHYMKNCGVVRSGDLILFDLGAEYQQYSSDISRTFPVNGSFTPRQRELYDIVRQALYIARDKMRPGEPIKAANDAVIEFYSRALRTAGVIADDGEIAAVYGHSVGHSIGLDTHDPTDRTVFEPGMVMTCEPGLYVASEGIGIRLENDILITQGAPEDLVGDRLLCPEEIECIMQEK